ncbi:MAG: class I SAM-dependent methyltransferase [Candidatus Methanomethylicaceae archaeon]
MDQNQVRRGVMEAFDEIASDVQHTRRKPWLSLKELEDCGSKRVLDLGAGTGRNSLKMAEWGATQVVAADVSVEMLKIIRETSKADWDKIDAVRCDAIHVPFRSSSFDAVSFIAAIHHIPGEKWRREAMEEVKRVTVPGGRVLVTSWAITTNAKGKRPRMRSIEGGEDGDVFVSWGDDVDRFYHILSLDGLKDLVESAGLKILNAYEERTSPRESGRNWVVVAVRPEAGQDG